MKSSSFLLILLLATTMVMMQPLVGSTTQPAEPISPTSTQSYSTHAAISINGNADFASQATANDWDAAGTRDGSAALPFVIAGYNITVSDTISVIIRNTNLHFEFVNNLLDGRSGSIVGLQLQNVTNGDAHDNIIRNFDNSAIFIPNSKNLEIANNTVSNSTQGIISSISLQLNVTKNTISDSLINGIDLFATNHSLITYNTITNSSQSGIDLTQSINTTLSYNQISKQQYGIYLNTADSNLLAFNQVSMSTKVGINILFQSNKNTILNNTVTNTQGQGISIHAFATNTYAQANQILNNSVSSSISDNIQIYNGRNTIIQGNYLYTSTNDGILLSATSNSTVTANKIINSDDFGVDLDYASANNSIYRNIFVGNNQNGFAQATDTGTANSFQYNYWNGWTAPDRNHDGIVDKPYQISTSPVNQSDPYPLVSRSQMNAVYNPYFPPENTTATTPTNIAPPKISTPSPRLPVSITPLFLTFVMLVSYRKYMTKLHH